MRILYQAGGASRDHGRQRTAPSRVFAATTGILDSVRGFSICAEKCNNYLNGNNNNNNNNINN